LAILGAAAWRAPGVLRDALGFGGLVALSWPVGEGLLTDTLGWWGRYLAPGPAVWHTPVYCMLIGWLASTHVCYIAHRTLDIGYGMRAAMLNAGLTAFVLGVLGENLFVGARIWVYHASAHQWFSVPAFVPVAYGLGFSVLPLSRRWGFFPATAAWAATLMGATVGLGFLVGFFPR
jgi:hypothetical protein